MNSPLSDSLFLLVFVILALFLSKKSQKKWHAFKHAILLIINLNILSVIPTF